MKISTTSKVVAAVVGFGLALSIFAAVGVTSASAQALTASQLIDLLISLNIIPADKAAAAKAAVNSTASVTFTRDLTIGSQGADVSALQNALGVSPATGYFGSITKAAVQKYQASKGIATTGYVGPLTRASLNGSGSVSTGGTTGGTSPVINSGVEGTITATKSSVSNSTVREGDSMKPVLGIKLEAKLSDINVQRVKIDLGTSTTIYTKVFKTVYLTDDSGKILAQADLNSNTVVKDGTQYVLTLGGFSYTVAKDSTKYIWVKADAYSSIKDADQYSRTITLVANGVRGVDGAGIDQYAPGTAFSQSISLDTTLADSATVKLSTNSANFKAADVVASGGSDDDEADMVSLLAFDLKAEKDNVLVTDIVATVAKTGSGAATATKAYLFDGSTQIDSEDINTTTGSVTFDDLDLWVNKDSTKVFTLKVDVRDADATASNISASVASGGITAENSQGSSVSSVSGSASGDTMVVRNAGILATLSGTPTISKTTNEANNISTTSATVTFNVRLEAVGDAILFGTQSASSTFNFVTYENDTASTLLLASSTSFQQPSSGGVVTSGLATGVSFKLNEGSSVVVPVTFTMVNRTTAGVILDLSKNYKVALDSIKWATETAPTTVQTTNFMSGKTEWRSAPVF
jgi:peptidoglycan hydrolase-like protein with peptidoglycan-binding domain